MSRSAADRMLSLGLLTAALVTASVAVWIVLFVAIEAYPAVRDVGLGRFLSDREWRPTDSDRPQFGISAMLAGSLLVTAGAVIVAAPIGVQLALFIQFYAPSRLRTPLRTMVELLHGVPSVVFGFWGLVVIAPWINRWQPPGQSLLAGMLVLSLMILPTVTLTARAALAATPRDHLIAAAALGLGRWATIASVVWPSARRGVVAGLILAVARAIGETMAVVMVCGNVVQFPGSLFDPIRTATANIALEMGYAGPGHRSALFVTGLALIWMILIAMIGMEGLRRREVGD